MDEPTKRPWWDRCTAPHQNVTGFVETRRVRLTAALLLILLPLSLVYLLPIGPQVDPGNTQDVIVVAGSAVALAAAYAIARSSRPQPAIWLLVLVPWFAISMAWQAEVPGEPDHDLVYFALIPIILASLVLRPRWAVAFTALNIVGVALLFLAPASTGIRIDLAELETALFFLLTASPLILLGAGFLERTARKREEANEKLREAERYRLQLLNMIAHDLASPLTPVQLQMRLLQNQIGDTKGYMILKRNIDHMQRLIGDVRDLSRLEMERLKLDSRPGDLAELVEHAVAGFADDAAARHVTPTVQVDEKLPVQADPDRVNQVLSNLMTNALKFSPKGSTIRIHAARNNGTARVSVRDHGHGIEPQDLSHLFKPFSQVHDRTQFQEKGTGLGLYIAKGIIEGHGGRIWAESEGRGKGSTFTFEIPLDPSPTDPGPPANT